MSYAIIGTGKEGQALAKAFARKGVEVAIASRRAAEALAPVAKAIGPTIIPKSLQDAVKADIIILAIPFGTQKEVAKAAESWKGKIVIDVINAYGVPPEELGNLPSSVVVSQAFPGAKLVKAFNSLAAETLAEDPNVKGGRRVATHHRPGTTRGRGRAPPLLACRAPQRGKPRVLGARDPHRPGRRGNAVDPRRLGRHHAPQPHAAEGRGELPRPPRSVPGPDRPRSGPGSRDRPAHRPCPAEIAGGREGRRLPGTTCRACALSGARRASSTGFRDHDPRHPDERAVPRAVAPGLR